MKKLKVMTIAGTRPELIRLSEIIKKAKDDAEKLLSEKEKECAVYEAAEIKKAKDTAEVIVTEAVKEAQRYADGLKKQSAEKLSEAVGIVKDTLLK